MRAEPAPRTFTVDEYERMVEVGLLGPDDRVELIEGVIVEMPPIGSRHQATVDRFNRIFTSLLPAERAIVRIQGPVRLPPTSEPEPDVALLRPADDYYEGKHPEPAAVLLAVEVADTTVGFDRFEKVPMYARRGVREVWLVDLLAGVVDVYREPEADGYRSMERVGRGGTLVPEAFPDVAVPVDEILPGAAET